MCNFRNQILSEPTHPIPRVKMIVKTLPFTLPTENFPFKDDSQSKALVPGAGLSVEILCKTPRHLSFKVIIDYAGGRKSPLFECVSTSEIASWWPDFENIRDVYAEVYGGNFENIGTLEEFIAQRLKIVIDLDKLDGHAIFSLVFEIEPKDGKSFAVERSSNLSIRERLESWIGDTE